MQQITDMGYDADDVEMALINNKDDSESVGYIFRFIYIIFASGLMISHKMWKEAGHD